MRRSKAHARTHTHIAFPFVLVVILAFSIFALFFEYIKLQARYKRLLIDYEAINTLKSQLEDKLSACSVTLDDTNRRYTQLLKERMVLELNYEELEKRYEELSEEYNACQQIAYDVYAWINGNAYTNIDVDACVQKNYLNVPCVLWRYGFNYEREQEERIKSIQEFLQDGGGDCEDFSLFVAALIRTATKKGLKIAVAKEGKEKFWVSAHWYIPNAEKVVLSPDWVGVLCGVEENAEHGHCIVIMREENNSTYYLEAQDGFLYDSNPFAEEWEIIDRNNYVNLTLGMSLLDVLFPNR